MVVVSERWSLKTGGLLIQVVSNTGLKVVPLWGHGVSQTHLETFSVKKKA